MVGLGAVVVLTTSTKSIMKKLTDIFGNYTPVPKCTV